jgi:hypothetical protein
MVASYRIVEIKTIPAAFHLIATLKLTKEMVDFKK